MKPKIQNFKSTYNSIIAVHIISTGVGASGSGHIGKLFLMSVDVVHIDKGDGRIVTPSHHHCVLQFNSTSIAEKKINR